MTALSTFIKAHREDDPRELALQAGKYPDVDIKEAVVQIYGWQVARKKLPLWASTEGVRYPVHLSMEQCSSQLTAEYKAKLAAEALGRDGTTLTDLTAGFGVDATMIARELKAKLTLVERNRQLCDIAENNLPLLGVEHFNVVCDDCTEALHSLPHQSMIFIDPARRDEHGGKTVAIGDCTPNIISMNDMLTDKADMVMVKLSPMLNIDSAEKELKGVAETHIVSVDGECKEVLLILRKNHTGKPATVCVNITKNGTTDILRADEENSECSYTSTMGQYLYEPNASIMKACAFKSVAHQYGISKLHPSSHLYTSQELAEEFPGRSFLVEGMSTFSKKELRTFLSGIKKANLTVRNFPSTVAELRKRLKIGEGGETYLFATTLADNTHVIVKCRKADKTDKLQ